MYNLTDLANKVVQVASQFAAHRTNQVGTEHILYALTKGYLDSIDFSDLADFEQTLYREMEISEKGVAISNFIKETKQLPDDSQLDEFIKECKRRYL